MNKEDTNRYKNSGTVWPLIENHHLIVTQPKASLPHMMLIISIFGVGGMVLSLFDLINFNAISISVVIVFAFIAYMMIDFFYKVKNNVVVKDLAEVGFSKTFGIKASEEYKQLVRLMDAEQLWNEFESLVDKRIKINKKAEHLYREFIGAEGYDEPLDDSLHISQLKELRMENYEIGAKLYHINDDKLCRLKMGIKTKH